MLGHLVLLSRARPVSPGWRLALVCLVALVAATGCRGRESTRQAGSGAPAIDVVTARATREPVTRLLRVTGSLTADEEAEVAAGDRRRASRRRSSEAHASRRAPR
jgi:multidrug efflux pump subunit AcrA (membrane-fusion protein)